MGIGPSIHSNFHDDNSFGDDMLEINLKSYKFIGFHDLHYILVIQEQVNCGRRLVNIVEMYEVIFCG